MISTLTTTAITNKITAAAIPMHMPTTCLFYVSPRTDKITAAGETMDRLLNAYASQENGYSSNTLAMDADGRAANPYDISA